MPEKPKRCSGTELAMAALKDLDPRKKDALFYGGMGLVVVPVLIVLILVVASTISEFEVAISWPLFVLLVIFIAAGLFMMIPEQSLKFFRAAGRLLDHIPVPAVLRRGKMSEGVFEGPDRRSEGASTFDGEDRRTHSNS